MLLLYVSCMFIASCMCRALLQPVPRPDIAHLLPARQHVYHPRRLKLRISCMILTEYTVYIHLVFPQFADVCVCSPMPVPRHEAAHSRLRYLRSSCHCNFTIASSSMIDLTGKSCVRCAMVSVRSFPLPTMHYVRLSASSSNAI
jgi:hypothetical protein